MRSDSHLRSTSAVKVGCRGEADGEMHEELLPVQAVGAHSQHLLLDLGQLLVLKASTWIDELVLEYGRLEQAGTHCT